MGDCEHTKARELYAEGTWTRFDDEVDARYFSDATMIKAWCPDCGALVLHDGTALLPHATKRRKPLTR